jgi:hypothetical protein
MAEENENTASTGSEKEGNVAGKNPEKSAAPKIEPKKGAVKSLDKDAEKPVGCQIGTAGVTAVIPKDEKSQKEFRCNHCGKTLGNDWPHKVTGIGQPAGCPKAVK